MPKAKTNLVIVESPSKAKTIGKYLGSEYQVKACMGHLRDLPKSTMGVDLENSFDPVYQPVKGKEDIISDLKKSAKNVLGRGVAVKLVEDDGSEEVAEDKLDALSKFDIISFE